MYRVSGSGPHAATKPVARLCHDASASLLTSESGNILPQAEWFALMARNLWQIKAPAHVESYTGYSDRTCRAWCSAANEPPARALALLLRSEEGPRVLAWVMRNDPPPWWSSLQAGIISITQLSG